MGPGCHHLQGEGCLSSAGQPGLQRVPPPGHLPRRVSSCAILSSLPRRASGPACASGERNLLLTLFQTHGNPARGPPVIPPGQVGSALPQHPLQIRRWPAVRPPGLGIHHLSLRSPLRSWGNIYGPTATCSREIRRGPGRGTAGGPWELDSRSDAGDWWGEGCCGAAFGDTSLCPLGRLALC